MTDSTKPETKTDLAERRRALTLLAAPGDVVELRAFRLDRRVVSGFYDDVDALARDVGGLGAEYSGIYITLNRVEPSLLGLANNRIRHQNPSPATTDTDITRRRWLFLDLDPKRKSGISSTDAQHDAAIAHARAIRDALTSEGWPLPIVADSGNGAHGLYRIDEPADNGGLVKRTLEALALRFDTPELHIDTGVYNPARIIKLYGTMARKGDSTPANPHRWSRILEAPDTVATVTHAQLEAMAAAVPREDPAENRRNGGSGASTFDLGAWVAQFAPEANGPKVWSGGPKLWTLRECPWRKGDGRSAYVAELASGATTAACQHQTCPGSRTTGNHWDTLREMLDPQGAAEQRARDAAYEARNAAHSRNNGGDLARNDGAQDPAPATARATYLRSDRGNAERLVDKHGASIRYCHTTAAWYAWDGQRWRLDTTGAVVRLAKAVVRSIHDELSSIDDQKKREDLFRFAQSSENAQKIRAMLESAQTEAPVAITQDAFDTDPWAFNCLNGTVDLRTGELRPHDRADMITKMAPVVYAPDAELALWDKCLDEWTDGDSALAAFLACTAGQALTGDTSAEQLILILGDTNTGKSTFIESIKSTIGEYATTADFETFLQRSFTGGPRPDIARLAGARLVTSSETDEGKRLAQGLLKQLTGGEKMTARKLYHEACEFRPQFKLWLAANHAPKVKHDDGAMWRRIVKVPFDAVVPEAKRDPHVKATLTDPAIAGAAILAWAVRGCLDWQRFGLTIPPSVRQATEEYRHEQDPLREFITQYCVLDKDAWTSSSDLRTAYEAWGAENGIKTLYLVNGKAWGAGLGERGCEKRRKRVAGRTTHGWDGIGIVRDETGESA